MSRDMPQGLPELVMATADEVVGRRSRRPRLMIFASTLLAGVVANLVFRHLVRHAANGKLEDIYVTGVLAAVAVSSLGAGALVLELTRSVHSSIPRMIARCALAIVV